MAVAGDIAAAVAPAASRKARRSKNRCSGVAMCSGSSQPRRRMMCMACSSNDDEMPFPWLPGLAKYHHQPALMGKSHLWEPAPGGRAISAHIRARRRKRELQGAALETGCQQLSIEKIARKS